MKTGPKHYLPWPIGIVLFCIGGLIGACILSSVFSPARQSDEAIRAELLKATPLGSSEQFVEEYAKSRFVQDNFFHWRETDEGRELKAMYGEFNELGNFPFSTCVRATWLFEGGQLREIEVMRWMDGP